MAETGEMPVTNADVDPTVATVLSLDAQSPPGVASLSAVVLPLQTVGVPVTGRGVNSIVITVVT